MKQQSLFHRDDVNDFTSGNEEADDDYNDDNKDNDDTVCPIIKATQKQQAKKTTRLLKKTIFNLTRVMVCNYIKLTGVQANSAKCLMTSSLNKSKYDPKMLSNMIESLQTNITKPVALMFEAL